MEKKLNIVVEHCPQNHKCPAVKVCPALDQKENAAVQELYKAILYYEENDTFMDLD